MSKREVERTVQQSLLDRLIDTNPAVGSDPPMTWMQSVQELKDSVRRDIEWLLNTRRIPEAAPQEFGEVGRSLYHYGLPDITSLSADSPEVRPRLMRQVEETIALFEPRLEGVRVVAVEGQTHGQRQLHFLIEGLLKMEPNPEQVVFDTVLEVTNGNFRIK